METYMIAALGVLVLAGGALFMLLGDFNKSKKTAAKAQDKRAEQRARMAQLAAAEAAVDAGKERRAKIGFGRR